GKCEAYGNPVQIEQLLFNLLDNAVKYIDPGGYLKIRVVDDKKQKQIVLNITNTTSAIIKEDLKHIFERFYRSKSGDVKKSFGRGLSIAKKIVEKHNGEIQASFDKNKKEVNFIVMLPT
ncbi:MAG: sensor histidine kinase, partial [Actinomycetia bacterium]|nr:sensor histidine kinase [Actinomycetes bacterium]